MDHQDFNAEHFEQAPHLKLQLIQARDYYNKSTHIVYICIHKTNYKPLD